MTASARGRVAVNPRGFGFLKIDRHDGEITAFVTPPDLNPFLDGDIVTAELKEAENGRVNASGLALVERTRRELFGSVVSHGKRWFLRVDRLVANTDWPFEEGAAKGLAEGTFVVAELRGSALVPKRTVSAGADLGLERCVVRHGIRGEFTAAVVEAAKEAARTPRHAARRRDLRELPTVTIDAPSTTDIDDALSVIPAGPDGALRVLVSIADVDAFVPAGSPLDEEARRRGTSVYLAGRVIPMLPDALSSEAVSLREGQECLTLTAELRIDAEGEVRSVDIYESVIRSHARLTYDAVAEFFATGSSAGVPDGVRATLRWLRTAAARLSAVRAARGGVDIDREEAYVSLDAVTREPLSIEAREESEAHRLVERLMVAANEAVAGWLADRGLPGLFRVHEKPPPERVEMLSSFAHNFGIEAGFGPELTPRGLAAFEAQLKGTKVAPAMRTVLGRMLGPARYTVHPGLHFGLAAPLYLHFTSPIRRYADLAVHRVLKRFLAGDRTLAAGDPALEALGQNLNRLAASAAKAEAERHRMLVARLFATRVGEVVPGNIVSVQPFGLVVQMTGTGATGTIALDALPEGPYRVDLATQTISGKDHSYSVGDALTARISGTNEELGRVELVLAAAR
jgi:ribonuclease R